VRRCGGLGLGECRVLYAAAHGGLAVAVQGAAWRHRGQHGGTGGNTTAQGAAWRHRGQHGGTGGSMAAQGAACRHRGQYDSTLGCMAVQLERQQYSWQCTEEFTEQSVCWKCGSKATYGDLRCTIAAADAREAAEQVAHRVKQLRSCPEAREVQGWGQQRFAD
jgi:hypothetical protein